MVHNFENQKCKYSELNCPYHGCMNNKECTFVNVRANGGNFGNKVCYDHEEKLGNWIELTDNSLPEKCVDLLVKNVHGEIFEFNFWPHCNVKLSAKVMGIVSYKLARV